MYSIQSENGKIHNCDHGKLRSGLKKKRDFYTTCTAHFLTILLL